MRTYWYILIMIHLAHIHPWSPTAPGLPITSLFSTIFSMCLFPTHWVWLVQTIGAWIGAIHWCGHTSTEKQSLTANTSSVVGETSESSSVHIRIHNWPDLVWVFWDLLAVMNSYVPESCLGQRIAFHNGLSHPPALPLFQPRPPFWALEEALV